jgi:superfamily I DNA/RNA helicase
LIIQQSSGKKAAMVGDIKGMIATISGIEKIRTGHKALGELSVFDNWQEFEEYTESGQGADLRTLASLTVDYGASRLSGWLEAASRTTEEEADVYISTAHRAKGREWDNVLLTDDFLDTDSDGWQEESANLLYVAVTRAKKNLDLSKCTAAQKALGSFDDWQVIAA